MIAPILPLLLWASRALAECGSHSFTTCEDKIVHWYDPNTGEICDPLNCGGGRAPVKYDVPGCAAYTGTETRATSASYLSCWKGPNSAGSIVVTVSTATSADAVVFADAVTTTEVEAEETAAEETTSATTADQEAETTSTVASTKEAAQTLLSPTTTAATTHIAPDVSTAAYSTLSTEIPDETITTLEISTPADFATLSGTATPTAVGNTAPFRGGSFIAVVGAVFGVLAFI